MELERKGMSKVPFADVSYKLACGKATRGQIKHPYVLYLRDNGLYGAMPIKAWKFMKVGTPYLFFKHIPLTGMTVGSWEYRDDE